ncbi:hypothetical protein [Deinococcus sp.]|nr:hypothetical protein [Deinococcus sp.]
MPRVWRTGHGRTVRYRAAQHSSGEEPDRTWGQDIGLDIHARTG